MLSLLMIRVSTKVLETSHTNRHNVLFHQFLLISMKYYNPARNGDERDRS